MATVTLAEASKLSNDLVVQGVIENILTVNPIYQIWPFDQIEGNSLKYNRENALGDVEFIKPGDTITAKNPATFTQLSAGLTALIGDAEVDHFIQTTRSNINDQKAVQIASKAKSIGRQYQDTMINGDITVNPESFDGLLQQAAVAQTIPAVAVDGDDFGFEVLDQLLDMVTSKDGVVDFILMRDRTIRSYLALLRSLGGAGIGEVVTLPNNQQQMAYRGVPIFKSNWIPMDQTTGATLTTTSIIAGAFDDGSRKVGVTGLTSVNNSGIFVTEVGESETKNETITRIRFYCGLAVFSQFALAVATGIKN